MASKRDSGMRGFTDLGSDVRWDLYGGRWGRAAANGDWYVIRVEHPDDAEADDQERPAFVVEVLHVPLSDLRDDGAFMASALQIIGWPPTDGTHDGSPPTDATMVEAILAYGRYEVESSVTGHVRADRLRADARRFVETRLSYDQ